ncbi:MAG: ribosome maturation factor RimM [Gemmatimonadota bacterium]|nr:ribosome maturation factor RimM [Gemmatimonadota bacterium]
MEIVVARLLRAHGLAGEVFAALETSDPEVLFTAGRAFRLAGERPVGTEEELVLESARPHGGGWLLRFRGREDRDAAERLRGLEIALPDDELRPLAEDEFYLHELIGLEAWREGGDRIGPVRDVYEAGGRVLLGVEAEGRERLVPFRREIVTRVDREARRVWIDPPAGLLEL